jgi:hypothetical protein
VERTASGIELFDLQEVPELADEPPQEADAPAVPEPEVEVIPDVVVEETGGPAEEEDEAEEAEEEPTLTLAERLQPRMGDPKIWAGIAPSHTELTDFERAELLLHGMIQSWNDSLAVAEALADRGRDWTYTDSDGGRWGLASGRLYLGDFSIPLPFTFDVSPDRRRAWAERRWTAQDLARGAATAAIREEWVDRARIMRERLEAERDAARSDGDGRDGG